MDSHRRHFIKVAAGSIGAGVVAGCSGSQYNGGRSGVNLANFASSPLVIAHRGACGYLPEHTLPAYRLGAILGADYLEPDLVFTKDGQLIARHDHYLSTTTDVASHPEFADRKTEKPGHEGADWFTEDFTLAEIKTLRAVQSMPKRSMAANGMFEIPTFGEVIALAQAEARGLGRNIGVYPETKLPGYFAELGYDYPTAVLTALDKAGWNRPDAAVFIQSFEVPVLQELYKRTEVPLIYLIADIPNLTMLEIAQFAAGIGPYKKLLVSDAGRSSGLIEQAHAAALKVHPWTFRTDQLPEQFATAQQEFDLFFELGVDGVFTDFPDAAHAARLAWAAVQNQ